jgi:hypothetical protein
MSEKIIYDGEIINKEEVINIVCEELFTTFEELLIFNRTRPFPDNRKILSYCIKKYCGAWATSLNVGRLFKRDHATILHGWKMAENFIATDPAFRKKLANCCAKIENLTGVKGYKNDKTVGQLLNELVASQAITERHKVRFLLAIEKQKNAALNVLQSVIDDQKDELNKQA